MNIFATKLLCKERDILLFTNAVQVMKMYFVLVIMIKMSFVFPVFLDAMEV